MSAPRFQPLFGFLFIGLAICILAAVSLSASQALADRQQPNPGQGVRGVVVRLQGDQMPTVGSSKPRNPPELISTQVWIFSGRIRGQNPRWSVSEAQKHPNLIKKVRSDEQGNFFANLPPGEYTLFAQYGSDLYLNSFLGDGSYASVRVSEGKVTETRLVNSEGAAF